MLPKEAELYNAMYNSKHLWKINTKKSSLLTWCFGPYFKDCFYRVWKVTDRSRKTVSGNIEFCHSEVVCFKQPFYFLSKLGVHKVTNTLDNIMGRQCSWTNSGYAITAQFHHLGRKLWQTAIAYFISISFHMSLI